MADLGTILGTLGGTVVGGLLGFVGNWLTVRWQAKVERLKQEDRDEHAYKEQLRHEYAAWFAAVSEAQMRLAWIPMQTGDAEANRRVTEDLMQIAESGKTQAFGLTLLERDREAREQIEELQGRLGRYMGAVVEESLRDERDMMRLLEQSTEFQKFLGQTVARIRKRLFPGALSKT